MADKPIKAFVLGLVGGIFLLLNAIAFYAIGTLLVALIMGIGAESSGAADILNLLMALMWASAAAVLAGSVLLLFKPGMHKLWGLLILVFSLVAVIGGGGFFLGTILGLVGGLLAILWKPVPVPAQA
jgi:hypothetical protein